MNDMRKFTQDCPIDFEFLENPFARFMIVHEDIWILGTVVLKELGKGLLKRLLMVVAVKHLCILDVLAQASFLSHVSRKALTFKCHIDGLIDDVLRKALVVLVTTFSSRLSNAEWFSIHLYCIALSAIFALDIA